MIAPPAIRAEVVTPRLTLAQFEREHGNRAEELRYLVECNRIDPFHRELHVLLAEAYVALDALPAEVGEPPFVAQAGRMYAYLQSRLQGPAGPLMKSLRGEEPLARERMRAAQRMLREPVARMLAQDAAIAPEIWNEQFTRERYADFVLVNLLALLEQKMDCIGFFLDIVKGTLYQ